jgi:hypothetical protein
MSENHLVTIYPQSVPQRPRSKSDFGAIRNNMTATSGSSLEEVLSLLSAPYYYVVSPGIYDGYPTVESWIKQKLFFLDFDDGTTPEDVKARFNEFNITPNAFYYTFRHKPDAPRFRVILMLDDFIYNREVAKLIIDSLLIIFPDSDSNCKGLERIYLGGNPFWERVDTPINTIRLIEFISINLMSRDGNRTRNLQEFGEKCQLLLVHIRTGDNSPNTISFPDGKRPNKSDSKKIKNFDFDRCAERVKIFNDFMNNEWMYYQQLLGIATNLNHVVGGLKLMKEKMEETNRLGISKYPDNHFNLLKYVKYIDYYPMYLYNFSNYEDDYEYANLLTAERNARGEVKIFEKVETVSLIECEKRFNSEYERVTNSNNHKIYIFKVPTGIGKTEKIIKCKNVTIALPTHKLIEEVSLRPGIVEHVKSPQLPDFDTKWINSKIESFYAKGLNSEVRRLMNRIVNKDELVTSDEDIAKANTYIQSLQLANNTDLTVLTTHSRAIHHNYKHETIIFDEDPWQSIIQTGKVSVKELKSVLFSLTGHVGINKLMQDIENTQPGECIQINLGHISIREILTQINSNEVTGNIIAFINASKIIKDKSNPGILHYFNLNHLPDDKKVIIMSASPMSIIYERLYGNRVEIIDLGNVESIGSITQYTSKSYSRQSVKKSDLKEIENLIAGKQLITFKATKEQLDPSSSNPYFGNTSGYDNLKGKDIAVLGTPHFNSLVYRLIAEALGIDTNTRDLDIQHQKVFWKGMKFMFAAINDEQVRDIQLMLIEAELIQAVGRGRTLRTDSNVDLFSNLPLTISNHFSKVDLPKK